MKRKPVKDYSVVLAKTKLETTKKRIIRVANAVRTEFKDNLSLQNLADILTIIKTRSLL